MENTELRKTLEEYLDLLRRNLAVASLEVLKTRYKKPFDELRHNISTTATAYVKQITLENMGKKWIYRLNNLKTWKIRPLFEVRGLYYLC